MLNKTVISNFSAIEKNDTPMTHVQSPKFLKISLQT